MLKGRARTIRVEVKLNPKEYKKLKSDCKKADITKSDYIRRLITNYRMREKPNEEFYYLLSNICEIGNSFSRIYNMAEFLKMDKDYYKKEVEHLNDLILKLKEEYL
jgi:hypothetical protein